jgi:DNA polymerase/3'-5' exonuclease PolX
MFRHPHAGSEPLPDVLPDNEHIARAFEEIAELLELEDANPFRIRVYRNAARSVHGAEAQLATRVLAGEPLPKQAGVGEDLAEKIRTISLSGSCPLLELLHGELPAGQIGLLQLSSIGPKRVHQLHQELGVDSLATLQEALRSGHLAHLRGFGPRLLEQLDKALKVRSARERRHLHADAQAQAAPLLSFIHSQAGVEPSQITGRLLLERDACALDMHAVIRHARQRGCFLELNAQPQRLDEYHCRLAKEEGALLSIASDAHRVADFSLLDYGVGQARRGWLERAEVLNSRSLARLRELLRRTRRIAYRNCATRPSVGWRGCRARLVITHYRPGTA